METIPSLKKSIDTVAKSTIYFGVIALLLGLAALLYPASIGKFSTIVIGVFLVLGGIARLTFAFISFSLGSMIMRYLYAILMVIVGIWIILNPDTSLAVLTMVMAIYFIVDGLTEIGYSFSLRPLGGGIYMLLSGIIALVIGGLIFFQWPESSNYALGIYLGIKLIIDGLMLSLTAYTIRKSVNINDNLA